MYPGLHGYHQVSALVETTVYFMSRGRKTEMVFLKSLLGIIEQSSIKTSDGSYKCINSWKKCSWIYQTLVSHFRDASSQISSETVSTKAFNSYKFNLCTCWIVAMKNKLLFHFRVLTLHLDSLLLEYMAFFVCFSQSNQFYLTLVFTWPACLRGLLLLLVERN